MQLSVLTNAGLGPEVQQEIAEVFDQLVPGRKQLTVAEILQQETPVYIVCCREEGRIVGIALMALYKVLSGHKAWIEDVVVDQQYRGQGVGRALVKKLISLAEEKGVSDIFLFTETHRQVAIRLYEQLGFEIRHSNIYTLKLNADK
jgi:phosphinothricin acetyltransferase